MILKFSISGFYTFSRAAECVPIFLVINGSILNCILVFWWNKTVFYSSSQGHGSRVGLFKLTLETTVHHLIILALILKEWVMMILSCLYWRSNEFLCKEKRKSNIWWQEGLLCEFSVLYSKFSTFINFFLLPHHSYDSLPSFLGSL